MLYPSESLEHNGTYINLGIKYDCYTLRLFTSSSDRRAKEAQMLLDEEKANGARLQDQVNTLNTKMRSLRRDKEDAEGEVETAKAKVRKLQSALDEAEENNTTLQTQIAKMRTTARKARVSVHVYEEGGE